MGFVKATRARAFLRIGLAGPSGSGKTYTALRLASHIGKRIAVIDTERGSASLYAGETPDLLPFDFDVLELATFEPVRYTEAIGEAVRAGYDVIIVDSLSHAWNGVGGMLEQVDKSSEKNNFAAWKNVTPQHNKLVDAVLQARAHVIFTLRSKTEYVLQPGKNGKMEPKKVGMAPVFRDGIEYESTVFLDLDIDHNAVVTKTRCAAIDGQTYHKPGPELARPLLTWLAGAEAAPPSPDTGTAAEAHHPSWDAGKGRWFAALRDLGLAYADVAAWTEARGAGRPSGWDEPARTGLAKALAKPDHAKRIDLDAWLAERAAAAAAEREPGEE